MRRWGKNLGIIAGVIAVVTGLAWVFQRQLIYFPDRNGVPAADAVLPGAQDITLTTSDDLELGAWFVPAAEACGVTVLVAPGNGGNRHGRSALMNALHDRGFGVLLMDYRGYGGNPGRPSEEGLQRDARAALGFLTQTEGIALDDLIFFGESLGSGVIADLAREHRPEGIVLRSPFTSLADMSQAAYGIPLGWLLRDHYRVAENIGAQSHRLAVVYGDDDSIVPADQSREVAEAAREAGGEVAEVEVLGADHNDPGLVHGPEVIEAVVEAAAGRCS